MSSVFANSRSIVHKGDGQTNIAAPPDVCKTPSPGGPIPIPYVNIAKTSDLASGSTKVEIEGNSVGLESSNLSTSSGDEAGTAGGIISSKNMGKLTWGSSSLDVQVEGKGVVRFMDVVQHNGNTFNTAFIENGQTGFAYADDFDDKCEVCKKSPDEHRVHEHESTVTLTNTLVEKLDALRAPAKKLREEREALAKQIVELDKKRPPLVQERKDAIEIIKSTPKTDAAWALALAARTAADAKLVALQAQIDALRVQHDAAQAALAGTLEVLRGHYVGYMIGVAMCRCGNGEKPFVAMSGNTDTPGFKKAVEDLGWTYCGAVATRSDIAASNSLAAKAPGQGVLDGRWELAEDMAVTDSDLWNAPGMCAATKIFKEATKAHDPVHMTERWYSPEKPKEILVRFRRDGAYGLEPERFSNGATTPSCSSCQQLLPLFVCEKGKC